MQDLLLHTGRKSPFLHVWSCNVQNSKQRNNNYSMYEGRVLHIMAQMRQGHFIKEYGTYT